MSRKENIEAALEVATVYGDIDGEHHKKWVIDQMIRNLMGQKRYAKFLRECDGDDSPWDDGVAP